MSTCLFVCLIYRLWWGDGILMDQHCYLIHSGLGVKKGSGATKTPEFAVKTALDWATTGEHSPMAPGAAREWGTQQKKRDRQVDQQQLQGALPAPWPAWPRPPVCGTKSRPDCTENSCTSLSHRR